MSKKSEKKNAVLISGGQLLKGKKFTRVHCLATNGARLYDYSSLSIHCSWLRSRTEIEEVGFQPVSLRK